MGRVITNDAVTFGDTRIVYSIRRSPQRRTLGISVSGPWVEVAAPSGMRAAAIRPYVENKADWILRKLDGFRRHPVIYPTRLRPGDSVRLFGRQHLVRFFDAGEASASIGVKGGCLHLALPSQRDEERAKRLIKGYFKQQLTQRLEFDIADVSAKLGMPMAVFQVRELGNRWGSCGKKGCLYFHWLLATQSPDFIRHVVAHEACHLLEPVHSKRFWRLLQKVGMGCGGSRGFAGRHDSPFG